LQKLYVFLIISYVFSSIKSEKRVEQILPGRQGEVAQTIYTHVSKCKNNKNRRKINLSSKISLSS
jgi:predicted RNA-binding protein YlqC (UPF0109 family)